MSSRRLVIALGTTAALFLTILALLAVQMGLGDDPAVGTADQARTAVQTSVYGDGSASDEDSVYDREPTYEQDDAYAVPQQQSEQAPLQSGTS